MEIFNYMEKYNYEELVFFNDSKTGLKAITCIHSTKLGPSLGGTRLWNYKSESEAIEDVLRLARGMSLKSACAGLDLGGGKTVIIADPKKVKGNELFWRSYGRFIESLNGRYITAEDVNTSTEEMEYVAKETGFVAGLRSKSGDPSPMTAYGVYMAMKASAFKAFGSDNLGGKKISVQGLGHVGLVLCDYLAKDNAELVVSDIDSDKVKKVVELYKAKEVNVNAIYEQDVDIFAPCGLGAIINDETIPKLKCKVIAGSANNVLKESHHGKILKEKGIVYAPDYVANAGGVINVAMENPVYNYEAAKSATEKIYDRILEIFEISDRENISTNEAADKLAIQRIESIGEIHSRYIRK
ncbi:Leu/Phe/Val dehydrogenase [Brachyspira pilosicoli]|uniref:Leu/Phe/Val dehydrogenase n=1 Tax=Brachyspira pilosicoli TaxID=52584 RepID=UPI001CA5C7AE|nr:Glu/Leu/Phe/Val dehydrogenase [Brachyspira pilosicoli]MBW5382475.1 Glu/Leu/Phe/Val dehydrogenase [Brachyspira pilosicoli]MBW5391663.1 Glu/Leu/Phe/Val dehydrogenase [Brachyspira pilosicoli]